MAGLFNAIGLYAQYKAKPKEIDPQKVMEMGTSPHNQEMYQRSKDLMDINSDMNQDYFNQQSQAAQDNVYAANRIARQNMAASGMSNQTGLINQALNKNLQDTNVGVQENFENYVRNNMGQSNNLLSQVTQNDMKVRDDAVSAYGQNINNKNNWMASMAGNVTKWAGDASDQATKAGMWYLCDANMKENIKKVGIAKGKNGNVGIYEYNYKGRDKRQKGIIAQEVRKSHPKAVKKGKNGKLYVNMSEVF